MSLHASLAQALGITNRQVIRTPPNPMDKSTVVSIYPKLIDEVKYTIEPGRFVLQPGSFETPSLLVVGSSSWWREIDPKQPLLEIPQSSITVANSIVKDYCEGIFGCDMGEKMPGLFWLPGSFTVAEVKKNHADKLILAKTRQDNYFRELIKQADSLWARSNGNPLAISDEMRLAARELNISANKEWMKDFRSVGLAQCPACGHLKNPQFPVCSHCNTITDMDSFKKLGLQQLEKK